MEIIKNKRILALIGIGCLILCCFLPYFTVSLWLYNRSVCLWGYYEGKIVLILTLANALYIFQDYIEKYVPQLFDNSVGRLIKKVDNPKFALVPTILALVFAISLFIRLDIDFNSEYIKYGAGFWLLWIGIITLVGHAIFYKKENIQPAEEKVDTNYYDPNRDKKYCPHCGNQVNIAAESCPMCGNKF